MGGITGYEPIYLQRSGAFGQYWFVVVHHSVQWVTTFSWHQYGEQRKTHTHTHQYRGDMLTIYKIRSRTDKVKDEHMCMKTGLNKGSWL